VLRRPRSRRSATSGVVRGTPDSSKTASVSRRLAVSVSAVIAGYYRLKRINVPSMEPRGGRTSNRPVDVPATGVVGNHSL